MKHLLFVYNCNTLPVSVGDVLVYLHYVKNYATIHGCDKISWMFLYNEDNYRHIDSCFGYLNSDNIAQEVVFLAQIPLIDKKVTEVFVGNKVPCGYDIVCNDSAYRYYEIFDNYAYNNRKAGIEWRDSLLATAKKIMVEKDIVLCLRNNQRQVERNSNISRWIAIINEINLWDRIIVVGSYREDFKEIPPQCVFAKDLKSTLPTDLAIVRQCSLYIGGCTGPCEVRRLYNMPAVFTEYPIDFHNPQKQVIQYKIGANYDDVINSVRRFL